MDNLPYDVEDENELNAAIQYMESIHEIEKSKLESVKETLKNVRQRNVELKITEDDLINKLCHYHITDSEDNCSKLTIEPIVQIINQKLQNKEETDNSNNNETQKLLDTKMSNWKKIFENTEILDFNKISLMVDELKNRLKENYIKIENDQKTVDFEKENFNRRMNELQNSIQQLQYLEKDQKKTLNKLNEKIELKHIEKQNKTKDAEKRIQLLKNKLTDLQREVTNLNKEK